VRNGLGSVSLGGIFLISACSLHADPLDQWVRRYPPFHPGSLRAVTYGSNQFVAVGQSIITSADGYHWAIQSSGEFPSLQGVAYKTGQYVAVGSSGTILVSSNAVQWSQVNSPTINNLLAVATVGSLFVAVGERGTYLDSSDGINWTVENTGLTNNLNAVAPCFGGSFAVGDRGKIWPDLGSDTGQTNNFKAIACGNNVMAIGGDLSIVNSQNSILYTTDLFTFQSQTFNGQGLWFPSANFTINAMAFGGGQFVAVGDTGHTLESFYPGVILTSSTGTNWTEASAFSSEDYLYGVTYGNGLFVAVGNGGTIVVSSNGTNWTQVTGYNRSAIVSMASAGDLCVASAQHIWVPAPYTSFPDFACLVSSNGNDWVISSTNLPAMEEITSSRGLFVGVSGNCIYTTTNGFTWSSNCSSPNLLHGAVWAKDRFVVVGENSSVMTSPDGFNWTTRLFATNGPLFSAAYGNGHFVAAGSVVATSEDGDSWSIILTNSPLALRRILFENSLFVGIASAGRLDFPTNYFLTSSSDGTNWQIRYTAGGAFRGLAYGNGEYLAMLGSVPFKSPDGINWLPANAGLALGSYLSIYYVLPVPLPSVCAYKGTFLVGGEDGALMQSGDTRIPIVSGSPRLGSSGFNFSFIAPVGVPYRVQVSSNLTAWQDALAGIGTNAPLTYTDSSFSNVPSSFFRVVSP
jgi:hypothetical protein